MFLGPFFLGQLFGKSANILYSRRGLYQVMGSSTSSHAVSESAARVAEARAGLKEAQREAERHSAVARAALSEAAALRKERDQITMLAAAGAVGSAAVAAALAAVLVRRRQAALLAEAAQSIVDLRLRGESNLARAKRFASEPLGRSLLPVLDNLDSLVESTPAGADAAGAELTRQSLQEAIRAHNIERLQPSPGDTFDPDTMEAMYTTAGSAKGTVAAVLRPGYALHGERLLRAAQVGVGTDGDS